MTNSAKPWERKKSTYVVAMFLGTALTALSPSTGTAGEQQRVPHQTISDVSRYCTACWRNARLPSDQWNDCTQEVMCRLLQRVPANNWSSLLSQETDERRELVRAIDTVKKRAQRQKRYSPYGLESCSDRRDSNRKSITEERASVEQASQQHLSPRQQRIIELSMDGWTVQQISQEMDLSAERVSDEKYKAIRKLRGVVAGEPG